MENTVLRDQIRHFRALWILVESDGRTRIGMPAHAGASQLPGIPQDAPVGVALDQALPFIAERSEHGEHWVAVVSVLRRDPESLHQVRQMLPAGRSRELDDSEYAALVDLGMDVPFGDWADRGAAEIFLLR